MSLLLRAVTRSSSLLRCRAVSRVFALPMMMQPINAAAFHWAPAAPAATPAAAAAAWIPKPVKQSTHIVGLDVIPNGREVLMGLLKETLAAIDAYNKQHGVSSRNRTAINAAAASKRIASHRICCMQLNCLPVLSIDVCSVFASSSLLTMHAFVSRPSIVCRFARRRRT